MSQVSTEHDVVAAAMTLDAPGRERVAELLWASLESASHSSTLSREWTDQISRRAAEVRAGTATLIDGDSVSAKLAKSSNDDSFPDRRTGGVE